MKKNDKGIKYGVISKVSSKKTNWGSIKTLYKNWSELKVSGFYIDINKEVQYTQWSSKNSENLCLVEEGTATILLNGKKYKINKKHVFKIYAGQEPKIIPNGKFSILSVQMPSSIKLSKLHKINLNKLDVVNTNNVRSMVYEYETLAKEIFTPNYKPGLGLIKFSFVNPIPLHKHPNSARLIRPISGKGYTYMEPNVYEAHKDTFALFQKGTTHTNGNVPGRALNLYAVQMPWIPSGIDEENIGGSPKFVKYVGVTPPKILWKKKIDFVRMLKLLK